MPITQENTEKLHRTVIFILFTGEEWGFWGSSHYVNDPIVPMSKTAAMINLDMVGRLRDDTVQVNSVGTGTGFSTLLDEVNRPYGFHFLKVAGTSGRSEPVAFYCKRVPNIHFITGKHPDYHKPTDTFDKLNIGGMRRIADYVRDMTDRAGQRAAAADFRGGSHAAPRGHVEAIPGLHSRLHAGGAGLSYRAR